MPKKDADDAIKIMYGTFSENEPNVSENARLIGTLYKKILKLYKQGISGEITQDKLDDELNKLDMPSNWKSSFKAGILQDKTIFEQAIRNST
ncbi:hypothetical protein ACRRVB_03335 [Candidatus Cardinium hertigii]|uniref:hypothetical protein n=1 Tax=Candidatus Cardinium hertigii TaxID=247481 RepID=UPI003D7EFAEC